MDKYQEALNNVKRVYVESEHYDEEDIRLLQELVDKATPKKPNHKYVDEKISTYSFDEFKKDSTKNALSEILALSDAIMKN